ncbi:hypothetical protein S40285_09333 [Stachybotrys chlorohalonatus IBT 40285]|uniref:Uncharacterized protein n=1 Tax=Stachybotrys chlorohalonatus (strain IBT 40285) TaxID=1283841 RepID=A0A084Q802_STAC4|nr:hypothetical protein S40285_09333 [Stachybotrys chlorohalonata IBT 40285]
MAPSWIEKFIVREDATPDPRRQKEQAIFEIKYMVLEGHRRILCVEGETTPRYEVTQRSILGAWGDKTTVTSPMNGGQTVAEIDFHSLPLAKTEIEFRQRQHELHIKTSKPQYESSGGLGLLHWKGTGMVPFSNASWELRDETALIMSVTVDAHQSNGTIGLWKDGLDTETIEELVVVGISQIEGYKRTIRNAKISVGSVVVS